MSGEACSKRFGKAYYPLKPIVPYLEVVHDRMMVEVFRGCTRGGCRFCQAGFFYIVLLGKEVKNFYCSKLRN